MISMLIFKYAAMFGIDPHLAMAVAKVESNFVISAVGQKGEIGLFQLMPAFFGLPKKALFDVETNIKLGIKHLAYKKKHCPHKVDKTWVVCYNVGVVGAKRIKHPKKWPYYMKVMKEYNEKQYANN